PCKSSHVSLPGEALWRLVSNVPGQLGTLETSPPQGCTLAEPDPQSVGLGRFSLGWLLKPVDFPDLGQGTGDEQGADMYGEVMVGGTSGGLSISFLSDSAAGFIGARHALLTTPCGCGPGLSSKIASAALATSLSKPSPLYSTSRRLIFTSAS